MVAAEQTLGPNQSVRLSQPCRPNSLLSCPVSGALTFLFVVVVVVVIFVTTQRPVITITTHITLYQHNILPALHHPKCEPQVQRERENKDEEHQENISESHEGSWRRC